MKANDLSFERLRSIIEADGNHQFFDKGDYNLNLIGVRSMDNKANKFNDYFAVLFYLNSEPIRFVFPCTTDPGLYYRRHPANVRGAAIVKPGQYRSLWQIGKHQGKYLALTQANAITVYRDNNKDDTLDEAPTDRGMFGINCHRANPALKSNQVDRWSAGCQVFADPQDFQLFMALCLKSSTLHGDHFTYTLITEDEL